MVDDSVKKLPASGDDSSESLPANKEGAAKYEEFYPAAEYYEQLGNNVELQIAELKRDVKRQIARDEVAELEYNVSILKAELRRKQIENTQLQAELAAQKEEKEALIKKLQELEETPSPKVAFENEEEQSVEEETSQSLEDSYSGGRNKLGVGGLASSPNSNITIIDRNKYRGQQVPLDNGDSLIWNPSNKTYDLVGPNQGLKFTYFAVEAAYLEEGYINPNYEQFYSQTVLRKQVWYERTPRGREEDSIGPKYAGKVPIDILMNRLNERVNSAKMMSNGEIQEFAPFQEAYKNWRYTYETGTYYKDSKGDLYQILDSRESKSKGNAPVYRTDGKFKSKTYGQRIDTSPDEKARWESNLGSKNKSKSKKGKK